MQTQDYWNLFMETGAPELYLLYNIARKTENKHVFDDAGPGSKGREL